MKTLEETEKKFEKLLREKDEEIAILAPLKHLVRVGSATNRLSTNSQTVKRVNQELTVTSNKARFQGFRGGFRGDRGRLYQTTAPVTILIFWLLASGCSS